MAVRTTGSGGAPADAHAPGLRPFLEVLPVELVAELGAAGPKDMGRVMAALKERFAGKMDFAKASGLVKAALTA